MLNVVVERSKWLRGELMSFLLRTSDGKMCCMGFAALACGSSKSEIANVCVINHGDLVDKRFIDCDRSFFNNLYFSNDEPNLLDSEREQRLKKTGLKAGIDFTFVD